MMGQEFSVVTLCRLFVCTGFEPGSGSVWMFLETGMSAALDNLHINFHSKSFSWLACADCESKVVAVQFYRGQLCLCVPPLLSQGIRLFPLFDKNPPELDSVFIVE